MAGTSLQKVYTLFSVTFVVEYSRQIKQSQRAIDFYAYLQMIDSVIPLSKLHILSLISSESWCEYHLGHDQCICDSQLQAQPPNSFEPDYLQPR